MKVGDWDIFKGLDWSPLLTESEEIDGEYQKLLCKIGNCMTSAELWFPFQCVIMQCSTARLSVSREKQCCNEALIQYCSAVQLVPTQKVRLYLRND